MTSVLKGSKRSTDQPAWVLDDGVVCPKEMQKEIKERERGGLTERDKRFLLIGADEEIRSETPERRIRFDLRKRAKNTFLDSALISQRISDEDFQKIVSVLHTEPTDVSREIFTLIYRACQEVADFEEDLEQGIRTAKIRSEEHPDEFEIEIEECKTPDTIPRFVHPEWVMDQSHPCPPDKRTYELDRSRGGLTERDKLFLMKAADEELNGWDASEQRIRHDFRRRASNTFLDLGLLSQRLTDEDFLKVVTEVQKADVDVSEEILCTLYRACQEHGTDLNAEILAGIMSAHIRHEFEIDYFCVNLSYRYDPWQNLEQDSIKYEFNKK